MTIEVACPSGLIGKVRGLTGRDGKFLTDQALAKRGGLTDKILEACWVETVDPGVYQTKADGSLNWGKVLQGDRFYALLQIRIAGNGDSEYEFNAQCQNPSCKEMIPWVIDLDDLPVRLLPEASQELLKQGKNEFRTIVPGTEERKKVLPPQAAIELARENGDRPPKPKYEIVPGTGTEIAFRLPMGELELKAHKVAAQSRRERRANKKMTAVAADNPIVRAVLTRTISIDGIEEGGRREGIVDYLEDMPLAMLQRLVRRFDEHDCGVETVIEIQCPECELVQEHEIPFDHGFFIEKRKPVTS